MPSNRIKLNRVNYSWSFFSGLNIACLLLLSIGLSYQNISFFHSQFFGLIAGLWVSSGIGIVATCHFHEWIYGDFKKTVADIFLELKNSDMLPGQDWIRPIPYIDVFLGIFERHLFYILLLLLKGDSFVFMGGWLALKLASSWQRSKGVSERHLFFFRERTIVALLSGTVSLIFPVIGWAIATYWGFHTDWLIASQ